MSQEFVEYIEKIRTEEIDISAEQDIAYPVKMKARPATAPDLYPEQDIAYPTKMKATGFPTRNVKQVVVVQAPVLVAKDDKRIVPKEQDIALTR